MMAVGCHNGCASDSVVHKCDSARVELLIEIDHEVSLSYIIHSKWKLES